jgi:hypothetical protein
VVSTLLAAAFGSIAVSASSISEVKPLYDYVSSFSSGIEILKYWNINFKEFNIYNQLQKLEKTERITPDVSSIKSMFIGMLHFEKFEIPEDPPLDVFFSFSFSSNSFLVWRYKYFETSNDDFF